MSLSTEKEYKDTLVAGVRNLQDVFREMELEDATLRGRLLEREDILAEIRKFKLLLGSQEQGMLR